MIKSSHATSQEAWEWANEFLITNEVKVIKRGGYRTGTQVQSYDHYMEINKLWVDPGFDFGYMFGYKKQKWSTLKSNYVDINMVELVRSEVMKKEMAKSRNYSIPFKFSNKSKSGHGCLISLVFQRRYSTDNPMVVMYIRASEVTKRLLMDFLLAQRITEYIYGENVSASARVFFANMWISAENFIMYHNHKSIFEFTDPERSITERKVHEVYEKFLKPEALNTNFKVQLRSIKRLQLVDTTPLKAKDLFL